MQKALDHATLLRPILAPLASLQGLEGFCYYLGPNVHPRYINDLAPVFRLPSNRRINAYASDKLISIEPWPQLPEQPNLERLEIQCADREPEFIGGILRGLPGLKTLLYIASQKLCTHYGFSPRKFSSALTNAAAGLEELSIEIRSVHKGDGTFLDSFRSFINLKRFTTDMRWLLDNVQSIRLVDILPQSLQELRLISFECHGKS